MKYFNSRPREGANFPEHPKTNRIPISIPAPARGRTLVLVAGATATPYFNSRPRKGANVFRVFFSPANFYFNSRPRKGANVQTLQHHLPGCRISIPAPARGRTFSGRNIGDIYAISIPAPARGRTMYLVRRFLDDQFQFPPPRGGEQQNCTK